MKQPPILLLDGWLGGPQRLERMRRNLEAMGSGECRIWEYDTSGRQSISTLASGLVRAIRSGNREVCLVGFSMGGLVVREALRQDPDLPVQRVACLNSPNQGTWLAYGLPLPALREMRPNSPFLGCLNGAPCPVPLLNVWCPGDLIVVPGLNARLARASAERCCLVPAHVWPLFSREFHRVIAAFFNQNTASQEFSSDPGW